MEVMCFIIFLIFFFILIHYFNELKNIKYITNFNNRGIAESGDINALNNRVDVMKSKLSQLKEKEDILDHQCRAMRENLRQTREESANQYYAYVTRDDLVDVFGSDEVILTLRNYDELTKNNIDKRNHRSPSTLRVQGRWKKIAVRLVTDEGEVLQNKRNNEGDINKKQIITRELNNMPDSSKFGISSSQPSKDSRTKTNKRRPGRRKRNENIELQADDDKKGNTSATFDVKFENEMDERRATAQTLLGYRPPTKQLKRNLDEVSDSFESR